MLQQPRLPFVRFETVVDQSKDGEGHTVFNHRYMAYITPAGGKDEVVKVAEDWLRDLKEKALTRGAFDQAAQEYQVWYERFSKLFEQYKAGEELSIQGTPLRACMAFTKAEVAQCESVRIMSLEDLAVCNEETIGRLGMNGRAMKTKAEQLLRDKPAIELAQENEALRVRVEALEQRVADMLAAGMKEPSKPGRKPRAAVEAAH